MKKRWLTLLFSAILAVGVVVGVSSCKLFNKNSAEEEQKTTAVVHFDVNTDHQTNVIKDKTVTIGKRVSKPNAYILDDNPTNLQVYGWYTSKEFTEAWDFKKGRVQEDMTLYARWVELYDVNYYVNGEFLKTENVFNGDFLEEDATVAEGFKYYGTYTDEACTAKYDFTKPVTSTMNVYVKRSEGIYLSDHTAEGELSSGNLTDNIAAYLGTEAPEDMEEPRDEEGWVEEYTVQTAYETGTVEEKCTYVNFGYTPTYGDGYVELCRSFDITQSQIIRVWYKNLGKAETVCMYFTSLLDPENNTYSETGMNYTHNFCYPNYVGNDAARLYVRTEMNETDDWEYVDFNLYEIYKNGYSVWATSPYLGALRLQANYKSSTALDENGDQDFSNVFLIKAIEGISCDVSVEDSAEIQEKMDTAKGLSAEELNGVSNAQDGNANGFVFPKDFACAMNVSENAEIVNGTEGLLFYAENEILGRERDSATSGFSVYAPEGKNVDLGEYTTLQLTLCNYGYASDLIVYVYNHEGVPVKSEISIASNMTESKTYMVNLYGKFGMEGNLSHVEILYTAVGVDNLIVFEEISFGEFVPYDTVGINLNDKFTYGFTSTDKVEVAFEPDREGTLFTVSESGASVATSDKTYKATTDGYAYATLNYILYKDSAITAVTVEYKIGGEYKTPYKYVLSLENKGKANAVKLPFNLDERGTVEGLRFTFEGTGDIIIKGIDYTVGETGLPYYQSYANVFMGGWAGWNSNCQYVYDETLQASLLQNQGQALVLSSSIYIGVTSSNGHVKVPHTTGNVLVTDTTKIKIVYQNKTSTETMNVLTTFSNYTDRSGEDEQTHVYWEKYNLPIDSNMEDYEWSVLTLEVPAQYVEKYISKISLQFEGKEIAIRVITVENGQEVNHEEA